MLDFIKFLQKRPSDCVIRTTGILFGLIIIASGYYNLIHQNDALVASIFGLEITEAYAVYIKYGIISLGAFPLIKNIVNKCFLKKNQIKVLQLILAVSLFLSASLIEDSANLNVDTLYVFMWLLPLFSWITGKFIPAKCLKHGEKIQKIRV